MISASVLTGQTCINKVTLTLTLTLSFGEVGGRTRE